MSSERLPIYGALKHDDTDSQPGSGAPIVSAKDYAGNASIVTLGCAKNTVDSEVMLGALASRGFQTVADPSEAELVVVNTCAFLESAVEEGIETILSLAELKKTGRLRQLFVAGCMVERYRADLEKNLPEVDRFLSTDELLTVGLESETTKECFDKARRPYFLYDETMPRVLSTAAHSVYVKVSEGCDRPCSFCIIPKIRGSLRSRPVDSIVSECSSLVAGGARELNLIAQDLTAYGTDLAGEPQLKQLVRDLNNLEVNEEFWIRLFYAYPVGVDRELVEQIASSKRVCNYLDMPLQHISSPVLKSMRRPLGGRRTRELIENIRAWAPEIELRTTFITGFPGETEEDVDRLVDFVSEGHFSHLGVFTYSQESEADSYTYEGQIEKELAEERKGRVLLAQQKVVADRASLHLDQEIEVLIEGTHADTDLLMRGRANWQGPEVDGEVIINQFDDSVLRSENLTPEGLLDHSKLIGKFGRVRVSETLGYDLVGTLEVV